MSLPGAKRRSVSRSVRSATCVGLQLRSRTTYARSPSKYLNLISVPRIAGRLRPIRKAALQRRRVEQHHHQRKGAPALRKQKRGLCPRRTRSMDIADRTRTRDLALPLSSLSGAGVRA
jgi:hypothetical protein